jgi:hypothetical protein
MSDEKNDFKLVTQPQDFFRELVTEALSRQNLKTKPETEFYLVNLLGQFMKTDRLYGQSQDGSLREEPLAFLVKEAIEESQPKAQAMLFRRVGDVSLYTAGFFQESLRRKAVDVDYYIEMGHTAYHQVASRADEEVLRVIYEELASKFAAFVDVLAEVSDKTTAPKTEKDLLQVYERWVRTGSDRAAQALKNAGIIPNKNVKKDWQ